MRTWKEEEMMEGYKRTGIDPAPYYWYIDQVSTSALVRFSSKCGHSTHIIFYEASLDLIC